MDIMKTDLLMKLVAEYYDGKDIEDAKKLLYQHLSDRNVKRKGENKTEMNLKDILEMLHSLPQPNEKQSSEEKSESLIFATATCNFPSLDIKNIDAGSIVTDIISLKQEVKQMREEKHQNQVLSEQMTEIRSMVSELSALTKKKNSAKLLLTDNSDSVLNCSTTSWYGQTFNEGSEVVVHNKPLYSDQVKKFKVPEKQKPKTMSLPDVGKDGKDWEIVKKKKKLQLGKLSGSSLKTVPRRLLPADVFVSRLNPETSENDTTQFVKLQFPQVTDVICTKLKTKFDTYSSFKITLSGINFKDSLNPDCWPNGVLIKRFYSPSANQSDEAKVTTNGDDSEKPNDH